MDNENKDLEKIRIKIDTLDYQIHDLINERAKLALEVAAIKIKHHGKDAKFYRPEREKVIIEQVIAHNKGPLNADAIANIFNEIIHECRELQINHHME